MGDDYEIKVKANEDNGGSMTTEVKFDRFYMYGMDSMGGKDQAPVCGTGKNEECEKLTGSKKNCCAKVVMTDQEKGEQSSMYRCMN